jgi:hypothetical protein
MQFPIIHLIVYLSVPVDGTLPDNADLAAVDFTVRYDSEL